MIADLYSSKQRVGVGSKRLSLSGWHKFEELLAERSNIVVLQRTAKQFDEA